MTPILLYDIVMSFHRIYIVRNTSYMASTSFDAPKVGFDTTLPHYYLFYQISHVLSTADKELEV